MASNDSLGKFKTVGKGKKEKEKLYLFLSSTQSKEGASARCLSPAYKYSVSRDL